MSMIDDFDDAAQTSLPFVNTFATEALQIHEAVFSRVSKLPGFVTFAKTPMLIVQPDALPRLSVYILRDRATPRDDEVFHGAPQFTHHLTIGISGAIVLSDDDAQFMALETNCGNIYSMLLNDPTFIGGADQPIEGISSIDRKTLFSQLNETPIAEIQIEITIRYWTAWPPLETTPYLRFQVTTVYPPPPASGAPQTGATWLIQQNVQNASATFQGTGALTAHIP